MGLKTDTTQQALANPAVTSARLQRILAMTEATQVPERTGWSPLRNAIAHAGPQTTPFHVQMQAVEVQGSTRVRNGELQIRIDAVGTSKVDVRETARRVNVGLAGMVRAVARAARERSADGGVHSVHILADNVVNRPLRVMLGELGFAAVSRKDALRDQSLQVLGTGLLGVAAIAALISPPLQILGTLLAAVSWGLGTMVLSRQSFETRLPCWELTATRQETPLG